MRKNLVSILTPCYNTGKLLPRLLESILNQDYPYIEMYAINDGSTDNTEYVIKDYIPRFQAKGYSLNYIYQENQGQSVAINNGLKYVEGEYLVWPDSDDFYSTSSALSKMVNAFKQNDDSVSIIRFLSEFVDEETLVVKNKYLPTSQTEWFEDCLYGKQGFWFCPGNYMIRMNVLDDRIKGRNIYTEKDAGQNWQLLLPLLYNKKCITINEYHYKILERSSSHSRGQYKTFEELYAKFNSYENTIISTLEQMYFLPVEERTKYLIDIKIKYLLIKYRLSILYNKKQIANAIKKTLETEYEYNISIVTKLKFYLSFYKRLIKQTIRI